MRSGGNYRRLKTLRRIVACLALVLFVRVLAQILVEYSSYFPPQFESSFLTGREDYFFGVYGAAFYLHIIFSPIALVLGLFLIWAAGRNQLLHWHRRAGRVQALIVILAVVPSGLVMSTRAFAGMLAGIGFATLAVATATSVVAAVYFAVKRQFAVHRIWATRCFILLCSPLLLRLITGATIVTETASDLTYMLTAWLSWLVPLVLYELYRTSASGAGFRLIPVFKSSVHTLKGRTE